VVLSSPKVIPVIRMIIKFLFICSSYSIAGAVGAVGFRVDGVLSQATQKKEAAINNEIS